MLAFTRKLRFMPGLAAVGFFILVIPVTAAIIGSLWVTAAAAYENVKFARGADQMLALIASARDAAAKDARFGQQPNEDVISDLIRLGQYTARPSNVWDGAIRATAGSPSMMRIEADLPSRACRRLAAFFGREASEVALQKIEARGWDGVWRQIYNAPHSPSGPSMLDIDVACGSGDNTVLALTLQLR